MQTHREARKAAPALARRRVRLRSCLRPNAFGQALGQGFVGQIQNAGTQESKLPEMQGSGPWSDINYRNGSDIESDNSVWSDKDIALKKIPPSIQTPVIPSSPSDFLSNRPTNPNSILAKEMIGHDGPLTSVADLRKYDHYLELQNRINNGLDESLANLQTRRNELLSWDKQKDDTSKILFYNAFGTTNPQDRAIVLQRLDGVMVVNESITIDNFRLADANLEEFQHKPGEFAKVGAYVSK